MKSPSQDDAKILLSDLFNCINTIILLFNSTFISASPSYLVYFFFVYILSAYYVISKTS